jgi:hypothetical protein
MASEEELIDSEENLENETETRAEINAELAEAYGSPTSEEKINQFKITQDAIKSKDNIKTTFLTKAELGIPLFSARFYLDCASLCKTYNAKLLTDYFKTKVQNISKSGMSNEGFIMKLNVTAKRDIVRRHERRIDNKITEGET